jgi:hypothetical protein
MRHRPHGRRRHSDQLHRRALHLVVDVDVPLCRGDRAVPGQAREHPHGNPLARKLDDERPETRVAAGVADPGAPVKGPEMLRAGIGREPALRVLLGRKQRVPRIAGQMSQAVSVTMQLGTKFLCPWG